jgi:pyruvate,orthophosphate dikinase
MTNNAQWVVSFADADERQRTLLGGKGAGLAAMTQEGLPVPAGFTITTEACRAYYDRHKAIPEGLWEHVDSAIGELEVVTGKRFGDDANPLLVSVRSGGPVSMPGMMDTILDLGLNESSVAGLATKSGDATFAWDAYRRFVQMYGEVVLGVDGEVLHAASAPPEAQNGFREVAARDLVHTIKAIIDAQAGESVPVDPREQLHRAVIAVFESWMNKRAVDYRNVEGIADDLYTAVNVQVMVFGNSGEESGTGVVFTRDPTDGDPNLWGEYLHNAQGEDIVAGLRTPQPISALREAQPDIFRQLVEVSKGLERYNRDMQDIEFTVEDGKLWMLQTRSAKRTGRCAVRCAVDMVDEGIIDKAEAVRRVAPGDLDELLHPLVKPGADDVVFAKGLAASPGGATGVVAFTADEAEQLAKDDVKVVLVRVETSPDDFHGMVASEAIVTARGGMTSHAAVVARGMGKCCVAGCRDLVIDAEAGVIRTPQGEIAKGDLITVDGSTGCVYAGVVPTVQPELDGYFDTLMEWADEFRNLGVRANADTGHDARTARDFGAEGIGLCRTEHMFFERERIAAVRRMIMAETPEERELALNEIEPLQADDFEEIFTVMEGLPVTIRLLDPPLHEFLPPKADTLAEIAELEGHVSIAAEGDDLGKMKERIAQLRMYIIQIGRLSEVNPMLGHRGCRLGVSHPEITAMQARAIFVAATRCVRKGIVVLPEIMVPLVAFSTEYEDQRRIIETVAGEVFESEGIRIEYEIGSMIELPRAALTADAIAATAQFISFGTNDLTQTALGLSRDDSGRFLPAYVERGIIEANPFARIDEIGVGALVEIGVQKARAANPDITAGVCGEHGGDPESIAFFDRLGMDYVSCSPYRIPIARLAGAHAALERELVGQSA